VNRLKIVYLEIDYFQIVYFSGKKSLEKHWKNTGNVGAGKKKGKNQKSAAMKDSSSNQLFQKCLVFFT